MKKLLLLLVCCLFLPVTVSAEAEAKVVRVGWFDSSFCYWDTFGRRCGIDYEYQQKIATYTGWTYEYVEDSWPNLMDMLMKGEIDLLSDVSYKPERTEFMSFPELSMGSESYYIYIDANNRQLSADHPETFSGKRIGVNKGSVQEGFLRDWAEKNGIDIEIVPLTTEEDESLTMLTRGGIDGYATIYTIGDDENVIPLVRIGESDFFYAVNKDRPDLLADLNMALSRIQDEDPYFNQKISEQHHYTDRASIYLTPEEEDWLRDRDTVRVAYVADYLPFCGQDPDTGELNGALRDYLAHAENLLRKSGVKFTAFAYPTVKEALAALADGEADCVFPVSLSTYDSELRNVYLTSPVMKTGMNAVLRSGDEETLSRDSRLEIAVPSGNPNVETFVMDQYPGCRVVTFPDNESCFEAVADEIAACTLISNYRALAAEDTLEQYDLYSVPTGEHLQFSFAVNKSDRPLYFILNKTAIAADGEDMDSALASHMRLEKQVSLMRVLRDNWLAIIGVLVVIFAVITVLLLQRLKAQRRANEQQRLLEEAEQVAELKQTISSLLDNMPGMNCTKDAKTGVYLACNQAFAEHAHRKDPASVIGLTDAELFDAASAKRYAEDDRMALSMDEPYIFFEEVPVLAGGRRQIKTTKLKYTDATGRLCVLGISLDVTDTLRNRRTRAESKESYEKARGTAVVYSHIAQALARGYTDLYYVDLNSEEFTQYRTDASTGSLSEVRRGWHFFEECREEAEQVVFPEDREAVQSALDRHTLLAALDQSDTFMMTHRILGENGPVYVSMTVTRMDEDFIVLGIRDVDGQVRAQKAATRAAEEQTAYTRLSALAGNFLCIYVVDPETAAYREFSTTAEYLSFGQAKDGADFFETTREAAKEFFHPDDLSRFLSAFTKENILSEIASRGIFTVSYRLFVEGKPRYVRLKAVLLEEKEGTQLIVGVNDIDAQVRQEEDYVKHLARARLAANADSLTGVKNRHAYLEAEERLNTQLSDDPNRPFAVVILDVNDLKRVNDREGHQAGDELIREACRVICRIFSHSPVFRVGGDEFVVLAQGEDYERIDSLVADMAARNAEARASGGVVIACGMARREKDETVAPVFERADRHMYENKSDLKNG